MPTKHSLFNLVSSGIGGGFVVLAFATLFLSSKVPASQSPSYIRDGIVHTEDASKYWAGRIVSIGGKVAYAEMSHVAEKLSVPEAHSLAHAFGDALFESEGLKGAGTCGNDFLWGCYHQYVGNVLVSHGASFVPELYEGCKITFEQDTFGCEHGLGHGLLGFYGYSRENLLLALKACDFLSIPFRFNGCYDGVFMEYNMRELTAIGTRPVDPRPFSEREKYSPCFEIDSRYQEMCARELPIWWSSATGVFHSTTTVLRFATMGNWCKGLNDSNLEHFCFRGIGHVAVQDLNPERFGRLCDAATQDELDNLHCRTFAAFRFKKAAGRNLESAWVCKSIGLIGAHLDYCVANLESNRAK